ncbi:SPRY domain-containing protein 3-like isoform X1 [Argiope bruennichi]|uniref:SPRY domain-containing protein 3 n=1 Tax=Argiope bruennichi TaxID=94029 RepID=A0A8T0EEE9_ARGBR|nr:SPRY domain-containing protein 3-like isoform X1 [Argiope bruennichi]KAF8771023.1 SPRY domain-containing protein 3 [Argiope bruennichi]
MDGVLQRHTSRLYGRALFERLCEHMKQVRQERVAIDGDLISYAPDEFGNVGMYVAAEPLTPERNYFEIEIVDPGVENNIVVGLVSAKHPLDQYPGWIPDSVGYHVGDGSLYRDAPKGVAFGPMCEAGDHIGVGIKLDSSASQNNKQNYCVVFFTNNGKEFGSTICSNTTGALYPAVGFHSTGEEVRLSLDMRWMPEEDMSMCIDSNEEEWSRLHDIKLNGTILEYSGRGKSIIDVGLAQAKYPLDTTHHYFEIEILDPGENCYIAIGLARKDYPKYRHPGWNKGSIAYHADDGKIFVGSGVGDPFGPRCHKGDIMGCGIIFPRDFVSFYDCDLDSNAPSSVNLDLEEDFSGSYSESEDEEWWKEKENIETGLTIQVFFTRNGKTVGQKEVCIPKGGFYPTVGMLSSDERVKVDLHPLTG